MHSSAFMLVVIDIKLNRLKNAWECEALIWLFDWLTNLCVLHYRGSYSIASTQRKHDTCLSIQCRTFAGLMFCIFYIVYHVLETLASCYMKNQPSTHNNCKRFAITYPSFLESMKRINSLISQEIIPRGNTERYSKKKKKRRLYTTYWFFFHDFTCSLLSFLLCAW